MCYDYSITAPDTKAASIQTKLRTQLSQGQRSCMFASRQPRFKEGGESIAETSLTPKPDLVDMSKGSARVVYTMRSKRRRFEWEKPPPKAIKSDIPDVILKKRTKPPPGENPFHRTIQGKLNGHDYASKPNYTKSAFTSKGAAHPISGYYLRQTLYSNQRTRPPDWIASGELAPGSYEMGDSAASLWGEGYGCTSMFKSKRSTGTKEIEDDWRTSPNICEDWTKERTHWSHESGRLCQSTFKDCIHRFKPIPRTLGPGNYKISADKDVTKPGVVHVKSSFQSTTPQIVPFKVTSELEALDLHPHWETHNRHSPLDHTTSPQNGRSEGRESPEFQSKSRRPWRQKNWQGEVHPNLVGEHTTTHTARAANVVNTANLLQDTKPIVMMKSPKSPKISPKISATQPMASITVTK